MVESLRLVKRAKDKQWLNSVGLNSVVGRIGYRWLQAKLNQNFSSKTLLQLSRSTVPKREKHKHTKASDENKHENKLKILSDPSHLSTMNRKIWVHINSSGSFSLSCIFTALDCRRLMREVFFVLRDVLQLIKLINMTHNKYPSSL
jgi:hypothetical protein